MQIHYALYDQSVFIDGSYWAWSASEIRELQDRFYNVAKEHLPPNPNTLQDDDLWGGLVRFVNWTVVYRYVNGGRDTKGRPHSILLTAWVSSADAEQVDLLPILTNDTFSHVLENARKRPVPRPFALKENWTTEKITPSSFQEGTTPFSDLTEAMRAFAAVPSARKAKFEIADVKIIKTSRVQKFVLNVTPELKPDVSIKATPIPSSVMYETTDKPVKSTKSDRRTHMSLNRLFSVLAIVLIFAIVFAIYKDTILTPIPHNSPSEETAGVIQPSLQPQLQPQEQIKDMFRRLLPNERFDLIQELQKIDREMLNSSVSPADDKSRPKSPSSPQQEKSQPVSPRTTTNPYSPFGG